MCYGHAMIDVLTHEQPNRIVRVRRDIDFICYIQTGGGPFAPGPWQPCIDGDPKPVRKGRVLYRVRCRLKKEASQ